MCTIDASQAVEALGIQRPVEIRIRRDTEHGLLLEFIANDGIMAGGVSPEDGTHHVLVRPDAVQFADDDLRAAVAHELFHVAQQETFSNADAATVAYRLASADPAGNRFELAAIAESAPYAGLVQVTDCGGHAPWTIEDLFPGYDAVPSAGE